MHLYGGDNEDTIPRDGMNAGGTYGSGDHSDQNAWFNAMPSLVGEKSFIQYYNDTTDGTANYQRYPFPGGRGKIFHCSSAKMSQSEATSIVSGAGAEGFFSYGMNIDLKRNAPGYSGSDNYTYPKMPKLVSIRRPTQTVLLFDLVFNPVTEVVNSSPQFNSVNPANRWRSFASRHNLGGNIVFLDGHVTNYKTKTVQAGGSMTGGAQEVAGSPLIWNPPYREANP
jgi:prepilin-type processing-associated H-X9-DG protein